MSMQIPPASSVTASVATGLSRDAQTVANTGEAARQKAAQPKLIQAESEAAIKLDISGSIAADREASRQLPQWFAAAEVDANQNEVDDGNSSRPREESQCTGEDIPKTDSLPQPDPGDGNSAGLDMYG